MVTRTFTFRPVLSRGLFAKMVLVIAPVFALIAGLGLWALSVFVMLEAEDIVTSRLGNAAGRVTSALERHAYKSKADDPWKEALPRELLNNLMADPAVRCVTFLREDEKKTRLIAPRGIGCTGQVIDDEFEVPFNTGVKSKLIISYSWSEISTLWSKSIQLSAGVLFGGLLLSIIAAWIGFRIFIKAPLQRLCTAILSSEQTGEPVEVVVTQNDELGNVMRTFNGMQRRDHENTVLLQRERTKLSRILDGMMDGLLVVDRDMRITLANQAALRLLKRPMEDIIGASILTLFRSIHDNAKEDDSFSYIEAVLPDGKATPVLTSVASMDGTQDAATICVVRDISGVIEHKNALRQTTLEALTANRAKSEFLANMSHELRTPLNAIIGFSDIIASGMIGGPVSKETAGYAKDINDSGKHLLELINDILDVSKVEAGEVKLYREEVELKSACNAVLRILQTNADQGHVALLLQTNDGGMYFHADPLRLKQIIINLVSNAIKFTPEGGSVTIHATESDAAVEVSVRDTGIGMSEDEIKEAIKPFRQVDNTHTRRYEGTGLGLSLTKSLVELHGGTLSIASVKGQGTEVTVTFPKDNVQACPQGDDAVMLKNIA